MYLSHRLGGVSINDHAANRLAVNMSAAGLNNLSGTVAPFGDNPSLSASLQASLSENSGLPPFLRNLVGNPLSRSTSVSPHEHSNSTSPTLMVRGAAKYQHSSSPTTAVDEDEMRDDYGHSRGDDEDYEDDCDLMDEVQDLRVSSKQQSPESMVNLRAASSDREPNGLVTYKEIASIEDDRDDDGTEDGRRSGSSHSPPKMIRSHDVNDDKTNE